MDDFQYKWFALIGLSLCAFTAFLDYTIVSVATPYIQADFNVKITTLQWITSIFSMFVSMSMIPAGKISEFFDRRFVFYSGFIFFGIASIGAALSPNIYSLIGFRALQGLGTAIVFTQSATLLPQAFPADQQRFAISIYSVFTGLGLALGPFIGGFIISWLNWRYIFWFNIPIILIGLMCCIPSLKKPPTSSQRFYFDFVGLLLLIISIGSIIFGMVMLEQLSNSSTRAIIGLSIGIIATIALLLYEKNHHTPLIKLDYFKNKYVLLGITISIAAGAIISIFLFLDPIYLKIIKQFDAHYIGILLVAMPALQIVISACFPKLVKISGLIPIIIIGMTIGLIATLLNTYFSASSTTLFIVITFGLLGVLWACANTGVIMLVSEHFTEKTSGVIFGFIFTFWNIASAFFLSLSSILFYYFDSLYLKSSLKNISSTLHPHDLDWLNKAISDPSNAVQMLHQSNSNNNLYHIFSGSFTHALSTVSWLSFSLLLLLIVITVALNFKDDSKELL